MANSSLHGMEKLFRGILRYSNTFKGNMVKQFIKVRDNPRPSAVFFTCIDSRMLPTRFTQTNVGDMFIVRNVGNMVPHSSNVASDSAATEPAALELGCLYNNIKHVIVCGHSDCKAMNLLYTVHKSENWSKEIQMQSPIKAWLNLHGMDSLMRYEQVERTNFHRPLIFHEDSPEHRFEAYIDINRKLNETDKLSQVNTLVQLENIASYSFMNNPMRGNRTKTHALWFDIYTGEVYYFSRAKKHFVRIRNDNVDILLDELKETQSMDSLETAKSILSAANEQISRQENCCSSADHEKVESNIPQ